MLTAPAILGKNHDIGIVTLQCVGNSRQPGSAALSDVPSKQPHCSDFTESRAAAVSSLALINRQFRRSALVSLGALIRPAALRPHRGTESSNPSHQRTELGEFRPREGGFPMVSSRSFGNDHLIDRLAAGIAGAAGRISSDVLRHEVAVAVNAVV